MTQTTDTDNLDGLMDRYVDGDKRAFVELHKRLTPRLRGFLSRYAADEGTLDDLLQQTFLRAHLARTNFAVRGSDHGGAVQGWYFTIARNLAMDELRKQSRGARKLTLHTGDDKIANMTDQEPTVEKRCTVLESRNQVVAQVRNAVAALPKSQRDVVELHKLRGLSMAQVAARLKIREGAARVRAHRGYKTLARLLAQPAPALMLLAVVSSTPLNLLRALLSGFEA